MSKVTGGCLCRKVTYTAQLKTGIGACHCGMCRKWSSGPLMSAHADGDIDITGKEHVSVFQSSQWAERAFCQNCGSNLYYLLKPNPAFPSGEYILAAGTLDEQESLVFDHEVYVDKKPSWYSFTDEDKRHRMTEADILEKFGPD